MPVPAKLMSFPSKVRMSLISQEGLRLDVDRHGPRFGGRPNVPDQSGGIATLLTETEPCTRKTVRMSLISQEGLRRASALQKASIAALTVRMSLISQEGLRHAEAVFTLLLIEEGPNVPDQSGGIATFIAPLIHNRDYSVRMSLISQEGLRRNVILAIPENVRMSECP